MVSFTEISLAIKENPNSEYAANPCVSKHQSAVEFLRIPTADATDHPGKTVNLSALSGRATKAKDTDPAVPNRLRSPPVEPMPVPILEPKIMQIAVPAPTPVPVPTRIPLLQTLIPQTPSLQTTVSSPEREQQRNGPQSNRGIHDPICIGISLRDPMYEIASPNVKQSIEVEEARMLEEKIGTLYKEESGRSRGWVKSALEAFFQPRSASGGSVYAKQAFDWSKIGSDKDVSAILDFICISKGIRLAVWNSAEHRVRIWPAADRSDAKETPPLLHYSSEGRPLSQKTSVFETGWTLSSALSVEHTLTKLTLAELASVAEKMGMNTGILSAKKSERVQQIADERARLRFR